MQVSKLVASLWSGGQVSYNIGVETAHLTVGKEAVVKQSNETKNTTGTVAIYSRVATEDNQAIMWQRESVLQYAIEQGYTDIIHFSDNGISGTTSDRPAFTEMEKAISSGKIKTVLVKNLSRIGRNNSDIMGWLANCERLGVNIISMTEGDISLVADLFTLYESLARGGTQK